MMMSIRHSKRALLRSRAAFRLESPPVRRPGLVGAHGAGARLYAIEAAAPRLAARSYVADGACLVGGVTLGDRASVWFGAVLRADNGPIRVGCESNIQDAAVVHCLPGGEVTIGAQVSIGHLAAIHGASIGNRCLIGMSAIVMDGACIADDTLVAAGAVVCGGRSFGPGVLLRGNPAQPVRTLTDRELTLIRNNAQQYVDRADRFRHVLRRL